ncbi:MAG: outer membrane beta-barrel protein [Terracidiphilus sp.]
MPEARADFHATRKRLVHPAACLPASFLLASCLLLSPGRLSSQVVPAAHGSSDNIWAGAEYSNYLPDFGPSQRITGIGAYADWNVTSRLGIEGEVRFLRFGGFSGESQDNYLAGPRITLLHRGKLVLYAKVLAGIAQNEFPFTIGTGRYLALAPGGGLDYRLSQRVALRGEFEYQLWPSAPGVSGEPSNGMKPNGFSVGFAYRLFGK